MFMKKNLLHLQPLLLAAGALVLVSSCQDYEPFSDQHVQDVAYTHEFVKQFGKIDPNQNWDLFGQLKLANLGRGALTRSASSSEVTVTNEDYYLIIYPEATTAYENVLPENRFDTDRALTETNLGRVTQDFVLSASEFTIEQLNYGTGGVDHIGIYWYITADEYGQESNDTQISGRDGETYYIRRKEIYKNKTNIEGWREIKYYEEVNINTTLFDNELSVEFPTRYQFADGSQYNQSHNAFASGTRVYDTGTTGTYNGETYVIWGQFYDAGWWYGNTDIAPEVVKTDLMTLHHDYMLADGTTAYPTNAAGTNTTTWRANCLLRRIETEQRIYTDYNDGNNPVDFDADGQKHYQYAYSYFNKGATCLHSIPIHVTIPESIPYYGFYIYNEVKWGDDQYTTGNNVGTRYSEANLNPQVNFKDAGPQDSHFVCTFSPSQLLKPDGSPLNPNDHNQYLCFEDWMAGARNFDLNDVVFTISVDPTTIIDHEEANEEALLVCEDLANFDFDFNDDVLLLSYKDGVERIYHTDVYGKVLSVETHEDTPILTITAMAAGGAFSSYVYVNNDNTPWGEIHTLLGETNYTGDDHHHTPVNVDHSYGRAGLQKIISGIGNGKLPTKNVMPDGDYPTYLSQLFDTEGFFKIVCDGGKDAVKIIENKATYKDKDNTTDETQLAPQMMLLPVYFEWPQEEVSIRTAYEDFDLWVSDVTATHWIISSQIEKNITDRGELWDESNQGIFAGSESMVVIYPVDFTYIDKQGIETTYNNCSKVDFHATFGDYNLEQEVYAKMTITFANKPTSTIYLDFEDGSQLMEDVSTRQTATYHLSKNQLHKAMTGAIYFMAQGNVPVEITSAVLDFYR